jgi:hypothetical protein
MRRSAGAFSVVLKNAAPWFETAARPGDRLLHVNGQRRFEDHAG